PEHQPSCKRCNRLLHVTDSDLSIASSFSSSDEAEPHEKSEIVRTDSLTTCPRLLSPADLQLHEPSEE
ncbi:uncharacterized, partial [Tachysurus ichikawai]